MQFADGDWWATWPLATRPEWVADQIRMASLVGDVVVGSGLDRATFCLRYGLDSPAVSTVIPGSANPDHVRADRAASGAAALGPATHDRLAQVWRERKVAGTYNGSA